MFIQCNTLEATPKKKANTIKTKDLVNLNFNSLNKLRYFFDSRKKEIKENRNEILSIDNNEINRTLYISLMNKYISRNIDKNNIITKQDDLKKIQKTIRLG